MESTGPNAEQIRFWNEVSGIKWVAGQAALDTQLAPAGLAALERIDVRAGERVLDVGCGCGETTVDLARRVGPTGSVMGVDISTRMLARARERVDMDRLGNVALIEADAQTHGFPDASFDVVFSRFGVMFFIDAVAAFTNLRRALAPSGRLGFVCWRSIDLNPWMHLPATAGAKHIEMPPRPPPGSPGPFGLADRADIERILSSSGYRDVQITAIDLTMIVGGTTSLDEAAAFSVQYGPTAVALREAPMEVIERVRTAVRDALAPYHTAAGVKLPAAVWFVHARP